MLLLHLSDIHFRKGEVGTAMDPNAHLRNELVIDAARECKRIGAVPDAILISGDIAFAGDVEEYAFALNWLELLAKECGTSLAATFVVPGNHDVVRSIASRRIIQVIHHDIKSSSDIALEGTLRGLLNEEETARLLYEALGPYNAFAGQFFCDLLPPARTIAKRDLKLNDGSTLRISGLNSAFVSSAADKPGDLFVDPACFQILRERGVEHAVICHHPCSWLRQGDQLKDFLSEVVRLHLFGHDHTNRIELGRDWVRVAASAAHPDRTEPGWEPGYNLIELAVRGTGNDRELDVTAHVRVWQQRPGEFRAKTDRGVNAFKQTIKLDSWTAPAVPANHGAIEVNTVLGEEAARSPETESSDVMDNNLREISIRFFRLTLSQKSAIAGRLNLLEEEDANQPDFERFRRVFVRARDRGLIQDLDKAIEEAAAKSRSDK